MLGLLGHLVVDGGVVDGDAQLGLAEDVVDALAPVVERAAVADDRQRQLEQIEGVDHQIEPLVWHEPLHDEESVVDLGRDAEAAGGDRRMDDRRLAPIELFDSIGDGARVGDEARHPAGRRHVPPPQRRHDDRQAQAQRHAEALPLDVVAEVPGEAHRRVAVADVRDASRRRSGAATAHLR